MGFPDRLLFSCALTHRKRKEMTDKNRVFSLKKHFIYGGRGTLHEIAETETRVPDKATPRIL